MTSSIHPAPTALAWVGPVALPRRGPCLPSAKAQLRPDLGRTQSVLAVAAIVGLHLAAAWGLMQVKSVRDAVVQAAPIFASLLVAPTPAATSAPPPVGLAPKPPARSRPQPPTPPVRRLAVPDNTPAELPATPMPAAPVDLPPLLAEVTPAVVASPSPLATAPVPATAAVQAAPKRIPDAAVQYLEPPLLQYPPLSLRKGETGLVIVRAYIGTAGGTPRSVDIEKSAGHPRLDQAALSAVRLARFKPHTDNGVPVEGWALVPIRFELEK